MVLKHVWKSAMLGFRLNDSKTLAIIGNIWPNLSPAVTLPKESADHG